MQCSKLAFSELWLCEISNWMGSCHQYPTPTLQNEWMDIKRTTTQLRVVHLVNSNKNNESQWNLISAHCLSDVSQNVCTRQEVLTVSRWGSRQVRGTCDSTAASWPSHASHSEQTPAPHWQVGHDEPQGRRQWHQSPPNSMLPPSLHHRRCGHHVQPVSTLPVHAASPTTRRTVSLYKQAQH